MRGRKRHIITDANGLLLAIEIHAANENDGKAGFRVIKSLAGRFEQMKKIYADGGYRSEPAENVRNDFGRDMEIALRSDKLNEFKPLPKRRVAEGTFHGWKISAGRLKITSTRFLQVRL
ncbi:MAG: transposase [Prevotellaceae bacterium]|nr:transposase [Prevotellaceae bacterium]